MYFDGFDFLIRCLYKRYGVVYEHRGGASCCGPGLRLLMQVCVHELGTSPDNAIIFFGVESFSDGWKIIFDFSLPFSENVVSLQRLE